MVVNWIPGQMALADPPMAAGVFTSFLAWQLRPTRDCGMKALAVPQMRSGCAKRALESGLDNKMRPGVGGYCRLPDDDPWQDRNTNLKTIAMNKLARCNFFQNTATFPLLCNPI